METDEMELDTIGDRKTALFVIISDTDDTFNFVVSILYTQLFNLLCDKADDEYGGRLPVHVRCLLDEFANINQKYCGSDNRLVPNPAPLLQCGQRFPHGNTPYFRTRKQAPVWYLS